MTVVRTAPLQATVSTKPRRTKLVVYQTMNASAGDGLDYLIEEHFGRAEQEASAGSGLLRSLSNSVASLQRFMRSLSN